MLTKKRKPVRQSSIRYPWLKWFNGKPHSFTLTKGIDFRCEAYIMAQQIRNKGYEKKQSVRLYIEGKKLQVTIERS